MYEEREQESRRGVGCSGCLVGRLRRTAPDGESFTIASIYQAQHQNRMGIKVNVTNCS